MAKQMTWLGQGPIDFGLYDPATGKMEQGFVVDKTPIGCANSALTLNVSIERLELKETCSGNRGTLASVTTGRNIEVTLEMKQFSANELAIALIGTANNTAGGTVTGEELVSATDSVLAGDIVHTLHPNISAVTINDSANVALVAGTDYEILSAEHGRIKFLTPQTGAITINYTYTDYVNLAALAGQEIDRSLVFNGISGTGERMRITLPKVRWALDGDFGLIGDDFSALTLKGSVLYAPELANDPNWGGYMRIDALPV